MCSSDLYVTPSAAVICGGIYDDTLFAASNLTDYQWFEIQPDLMVQVGTDTLLHVSHPGNFIVFARSTSGCYAVSDTIFVEEGQFPIPNFTYSQASGSYTVSFNNTTQNGSDYIWTIDTLGTSTAEDTVFTFPDNGPYSVTLQAINSCDTVEITKLVFVAFVGIEEVSENSEIQIGPNPVSDLLSIYSRTGATLNGIFSVSDLLGRIVLSVKSEISNTSPLVFNLESLKTGSYLLNVQTTKGNMSTRFFKE